MRACRATGKTGPPIGSEDGITLLDALVATAILMTVTTGVAGLLTWSTRVVAVAGRQTAAVWLAQQKLEQLAALEWSLDDGGVARSDESTNVAVDPMRASGPGLRASPGSAADVDTPAYMDFTGADGSWRGDAAPRPGAAFVRRWSIVPLAGDPQNTLVITVSVRPLAEAARGTRQVSSGATLQTVRTRLLRGGER
jgi:type II secretory pathway pseudopilin PulG